MTKISDLFSEHFSSSISVNKGVIRLHGTDAAVLLGELISKQKYWSEKSRLEGGRFYWSIRDIHDTTGLKRWSAEKAVNRLEKAGLIMVERIPCRMTWYRVNIGAVMKLLMAERFNNPTVLKTTQAFANNNTVTVSESTHTNPVNKPNKKVITPKPPQGENQVIKGVVSLYYQLLENTTGAKPITNWKRDCSILKKAADGQLQEQDPEVVRVKLREWFKDDYAAGKGYPLQLFVSNYNNIRYEVEYIPLEHRILN